MKLLIEMPRLQQVYDTLIQRDKTRRNKTSRPEHTAQSLIPTRYTALADVSVNHNLQPVHACPNTENHVRRTILAMLDSDEPRGQGYQGAVMMIKGEPIGVVKNNVMKSLIATRTVPGNLVRGWVYATNDQTFKPTEATLYETNTLQNIYEDPATETRQETISDTVRIVYRDSIEVRPNRRVAGGVRGNTDILRGLDEIIRRYT